MGRPGLGFGGGPLRTMYEYQNLDYFNNAITINDWYAPLAETQDVKAWYLVMEQTNNGAAAEDIEVELTINGGAPIVAAIGAAVSGTPYYIILGLWGVAGSTDVPQQLLALDVDQSAPLETRSLQVRVRQTTAVDGVSASIEVNMVYATLEVT